MATLTPYFRVSFPNVFKPKRNDFNGKDEYSLVALFPKGADLSVLKAAAQEAITKKWGADKSKWPSNLRTPFRDQAERAKNVDGKMILPSGHEEGAIFMNLKSTQRPGLIDKDKQEIIDEADFYSGCWARASVNAFAYDQKGNRGVTFGLMNLQKVKDDAPLGKRTRAEDDFSPVESSTASTSSDLFS